MELHGQFIPQVVEDTISKARWSWLTGGRLKRSTEVLLIDAQDRAIRTNLIKTMIDKISQTTNTECVGKEMKVSIITF